MPTYLITGDSINEQSTIDAILAAEKKDANIYILYQSADKLSFRTFSLLQPAKNIHAMEVEDRNAFFFTLGSIFAQIDDSEIFALIKKDFEIPSTVVEKYRVKPLKLGGEKKKKPRVKKTAKPVAETDPLKDMMNPPVPSLYPEDKENTGKEPEAMKRRTRRTAVDDNADAGKRSNPRKQESTRGSDMLDTGAAFEDAKKKAEFKKLLAVDPKAIGLDIPENDFIEAAGKAIRDSVLLRRGPASVLFERFGDTYGQRIAEAISGRAKELQDFFR